MYHRRSGFRARTVALSRDDQRKDTQNSLSRISAELGVRPDPFQRLDRIVTAISRITGPLSLVGGLSWLGWMIFLR